MLSNLGSLIPGLGCVYVWLAIMIQGHLLSSVSLARILVKLAHYQILTAQPAKPQTSAHYPQQTAAPATPTTTTI